MQDKSDRAPRAQADRRAATRTALITAARALFAEHGYGATGTPEIVTAAGVTRGALYHHFADKIDLFRAVIEAEHRAVVAAIDAAAAAPSDAITALIEGGAAYLDAMRDSGRRRLLLIEAPSVLGQAEAAALDLARASLAEGVQAALASGALPPLPAPILTDLLDALFDRAATAEQDAQGNYLAVISALLRGLTPDKT
ncbi:MAG: TetR/AcrR family transcriptional regulator [Elstera sp.]